MNNQQRSNELEYIDLGPSHYTATEYQHFLRVLGRIGRFLGGNHATLSAFKQLIKPPRSILDIGCGGGFFTIELAKKYPNASVVGIDTSTAAIEFAQQQLHKLQLPNIRFEHRENPELDEPVKSYDVVTTTLVCHHLTDVALINFLKKASVIANDMIIVNDLHRHRLAELSFAAVAPLLFRNRLICHDGLVSIRRAFKRSELEHYIRVAELQDYDWKILWKCPFRWIMTIKILDEISGQIHP